MRLSRVPPILLMLLATLSAAWVTPSQGAATTAAAAGEIAQRQTGGRVLAVKPTDGGFQVKVLTPDGKVRYVFVPSS
ncbi:PepSY domain-containing protein [Thiocystis violacea]|uniref:PepSY domain-containing protein n=1 Tax=Thiocystis violacea TaxID=13725 RepID=UPI00190346CF|nr:hypothetical protein [Thiocystis violacea]MBK1723452.1 hypothetical protein [Thiocystis violacea]